MLQIAGEKYNKQQVEQVEELQKNVEYDSLTLVLQHVRGKSVSAGRV